MNESITVIDKNGNSIVAEGIACIQFISSGRKYVLYTLNEKVENDLTKMYVGEIGNNVGELDKIEDDEWMHIKTTLNGISHGEINPDLKYLDMRSLPLNIGVPKKLAIKADVKQGFNDKYHMEMLKENQGSGPMNEPVQPSVSGFFNNDVVSDGEATSASTTDTTGSSGSIFANPMTPDLTAQTVAPAENTISSVVSAAPPIQDEISQAVMQPAPVINNQSVPDPNVGITLDLNQAPVQNPVQETVPMIQTLPESQVISQSPLEGNQVVENLSTEIMDNINAIPTPSADNSALVEQTPVSPEPISLEPTVPSNQVKGNGIKQVTKEEALAALEVINKYILQNGGTLEGLQEPSVEEPSVEPVEVGIQTVEPIQPPVEEPAIQIIEEPVIQEVQQIPIAQATPEVASPIVENVMPPVINPEPTTQYQEVPMNTTPVTEPATISAPMTPPVQEAVPPVLETVPPVVNTPEMIPTIDLSAPAQPTQAENNFISMGVNDINNMVAENQQPAIGDALQVTGQANLINLDALSSIPEVEPLNSAGGSPTALTNQPISNAYVNSDPSGIPVTLPNNYNNQGVNGPSTVLGPGSLPVNDN